jgi:hypothetical protein
MEGWIRSRGCGKMELVYVRAFCPNIPDLKLVSSLTLVLCSRSIIWQEFSELI